MAEILWRPPPAAWEDTRIGRWLRTRGFASYDDAWAWSVTDLAEFWGSAASELGVRWVSSPATVLASPAMPGAVWFPGATLNYADHALASPGEVITVSQTRDSTVSVPATDLRSAVAAARAGLVSLGVGRGDRVAAYLPNIAEALVAFLATASLGAVWSSCPPEFGVRGVTDRFAQIEPTVLLAVDGYRHRGAIDRRDDVRAIRDALPGLGATVLLPYLDAGPLPGTLPWSLLTAPGGPLEFEPVAFDHPLYILYSSGTTGLPKPIVHGHGGILLEHLKMLALHHDMRPGDRFFWYSTTGWMMWNYLVSGLLVGASIVCVDGDPGYPSLDVLWELAASLGITHFGASAPYLMGCRKAGVTVPALPALREIGSTGAPLPAEGFRWVYETVGPDVRLASISGGTDVCTAFVGGVPLLPVTAGEITCRCLGARVEAFDASGRPVIGEQGTLVLTAPMPSMPVGLWGDADGSRYRRAYFDRYPGVWDHGDWVTITDRGTCVITGRSDSTLNRGGVRMGTSDFYSVVEAFEEVADSLVVHVEDSDRLVLFVQLAPGCSLDEDLRSRLVDALRSSLSPRHAPDEIVAVPAVPRTLSGKKLEVPVKRILAGTPASQAASRDALADPGALAFFEELAGPASRS